VFASDREGSTNLYVIGIDGTGEERLTMDPGNHAMASWSP
jgi:Tol biopolymer transport system component